MVALNSMSGAPPDERGHSTLRVGDRAGDDGYMEYPGVRRQISLLVADDHEVVTWGFRLLLCRMPWVKRCLQASDGAQALALARRYEPHVAIVDLELGDESGADVCTSIRQVSPRTQVLLMSSGTSVPDVTLRAVGASGYVAKAWPLEEAIAVIRAVGLGLTFNGTMCPSTMVSLSAREQDVLVRIAGGETNREIADALYLSPHTVKQHASAAFRKLQARNRTDAVQRARRLGLVP
jgi:DNA-binding NarL/FixJ family response regulator